MKPPISIDVRTDNRQTCTLHVKGAGDAEGVTLEVNAEGNLYQGIHRLRPALELAINMILASHGIVPDAPPSVDPETPADAPTETPPAEP
jgi:hypothetical protein